MWLLRVDANLMAPNHRYYGGQPGQQALDADHLIIAREETEFSCFQCHHELFYLRNYAF